MEQLELPILYRYESPGGIEHRPDLYQAVRETECGWWIVPRWVYTTRTSDEDDETLIKKYGRWVSKTGRKRFAYIDKDKAWESYIARKYWRVLHLRRQLDNAERDYNEATGKDIRKILL